MDRITFIEQTNTKKFREHFDTDSIVQIGSVLFNPYTKKITGFVVQETVYSEATLQPEIVSRWLSPDPLADEREWVNPYNFVQNNPILRIDPFGLTDFIINKKTGEVTQVGETNDEPDRVLKTYSSGKREGQIKYNRKGEAKVAFGGIEQGILNDGMNFKTDDNLIAVGGEGQATEGGVKSFTLQLSEYVGNEIKGFSYSSNASGNVTDMVLGKYENNSFDESKANVRELVKKYGTDFSANNILQQFHTHPNGKLGATQSAPELSQDIKNLQNQKVIIPNATFIILYRISGQIKPGEYDYTHQYRPKKR